MPGHKKPLPVVTHWCDEHAAQLRPHSQATWERLNEKLRHAAPDAQNATDGQSGVA
jgi:hypothetical protein